MSWCKVGDKFFYHDYSCYATIVDVTPKEVFWQWHWVSGKHMHEITSLQHHHIPKLPENWIPCTPLMEALL